MNRHDEFDAERLADCVLDKPIEIIALAGLSALITPTSILPADMPPARILSSLHRHRQFYQGLYRHLRAK